MRGVSRTQVDTYSSFGEEKALSHAPLRFDEQRDPKDCTIRWVDGANHFELLYNPRKGERRPRPDQRTWRRRWQEDTRVFF